jgi:hypothetical protein
MVNGLYGSFALNEDDFTYKISLSEEERESFEKMVDVHS